MIGAVAVKVRMPKYQASTMVVSVAPLKSAKKSLPFWSIHLKKWSMSLKAYAASSTPIFGNAVDIAEPPCRSMSMSPVCTLAKRSASGPSWLLGNRSMVRLRSSGPRPVP